MTTPEMKLGMWKTDKGRVVCVPYIEPEWADVESPIFVRFVGENGGRAFEWASQAGVFYASLGRERLVEHLSDDRDDPRTWKPPVTMRAGLWEMSDGSVGTAHVFSCEEWHVTTINPDGLPYTYICDSQGMPIRHNCNPRAVRYIGPSPLRGPTKKETEK